MSGFVRFVDGDWSWNSSVTHFFFDFLAEQLPDGQKRSEVVELQDSNVLMRYDDHRQPGVRELIAPHLQDSSPDTRRYARRAMERLT